MTIDHRQHFENSNNKKMLDFGVFHSYNVINFLTEAIPTNHRPRERIDERILGKHAKLHLESRFCINVENPIDVFCTHLII